VNRADRENLARLARMRARQAKTEAQQREKVLLAEVEDLLAAEFEAEDALWADAVTIAREAADKANELIVARCADLGIPPKHAPHLMLGWQPRGGGFIDPNRRAELRKLAQTRLAALTSTAKTIIDRKLLDTETALIAESLDTDDARVFLEAMPTAEELMPSLSLGDLGVEHYQPPDGAASDLLSPSTVTERKRRQIRRVIAAHPTASDREIAKLAGCDHKTVGAHRRNGGELPGPGGEFPTTE
jgi:hypothetical protein